MFLFSLDYWYSLASCLVFLVIFANKYPLSHPKNWMGYVDLHLPRFFEFFDNSSN